MAAAVIVLLAVGGFFGWRYYHDVFLPNKLITDTEQEQRAVFEKLRPDAEPDPASDDGTVSDGTAQRAETAQPLAKLEAANSDAVGWITIDGTVIDYPVVQTADNDYYLDHGVDGQYNNGLGCPFLDYRCKSDFSDFHSIIYAHHIQGYRALFSDITLYGDSAFMEQHPTGTLLTKNGARKVRFFAYLLLPNPSFAFSMDIDGKADRDGYLENIFEKAEYTSGYTLEELKKNDKLRLLLLSTCAYEYRNARGVLAGVIE